MTYQDIKKIMSIWMFPTVIVVLLCLVSQGKADAALANYITSIEYKEITLADGTATASADLTKGQTIGNCVPFATMYFTPGAAADAFDRKSSDIYFEAGPKVTAVRENTNGQLNLGIYVVEFNPSYVTVQQGTYSIADTAASTTASITAVDQSKAALVFYHQYINGNDKFDESSVAGWFSLDNELSFQRNGTWETISGHYYVFEAQNSEFSVQARSFNIPASGTSNTTSITSVAMDKTFLIASYRTGYDSSNADKGQLSVYLSAADTITAERDTAHSTAVTDIRVFAVTFGGNETVQRGEFAYAASDTQEQATLSPAVDTTAAIAWNPVMTVCPGGMKSATSTDNYDAYQRVQIINSGAQVQGDHSSIDAASGRWEVIEFTGETSIYYSVGTETSALYSGDASANSGTLTLEGGPAADKIGVGDEIQVGLYRYYITGRISSTVFTIQNSAAESGTPGDRNITFTTTNIEIHRAFNTITAAISGSYNSSHLNLAGPPYDLVAGDYQLNWPCYKDAVMDDGFFEIDDYTTAADNYIRIYTPVDSSEVGASQRHNGTAGTGFVLQSTCSSGCNHNFKIYDEHVRVEGIEIDGSAITALVYAGLYTKNISATSDIRIDKVLVYDFTKLSTPSSNSEVYGIYISEGSARVTNSIVYNITNENAGAGTTAIGIRHGSSGTSSFYNNTVYKVVNSGNSTDATYGFNVNGGTVTATNNYVGGTSGGSSAADFSGTMTQSYNMSSDSTAEGTTRDNKAPVDQFVSITAGSEDLHLKSGADAINAGDDLTGTFNDDIDSASRGTGTTTWDIGADEAADVTLADHAAGQEADKFDTGSSVTGAELFAFKLTNSTGSAVTVDSVVFQLGAVTGIAQGDFANLEIHVDENNDGTINGSDTIGTVGGTGVVNAGVTTITFSTDFTIAGSSSVNYILLGDVSSLVGNDTVTIGLGNGSVYSYRKKITIDKDKVSGTADLTSFPVLINITGDPDLRTTANGGHVQDTEGDDIIFRAIDGTTQLDHEVEKYDGSANAGVVARIDSNWSTGTGSGSQGPYTVPAASDSAPDRLLVFVTGFEDNSGSTPTIDGVTYGGVGMTRAATETYSGVADVIVETWYLKDNDIPAGSNSFSVTYNPAAPNQGVYHAWATFENVDQGDTIVDTAVNNGANPVEATVNVVNGGMGVAVAMNGSDNGSYTWGNSWDEKDDRNGQGNNSTFSVAEHAQSSDGTDTASGTHTDSTSQALVAVGIRPSPQLVAWVRIPTLKYNEDTIIYLYYGNSLISTSQENVTGVWTNGYLGVWHLKEDPSGTAPQMQDSTSTNHGTSGGTMTSNDQLPGKFGGSLDFDGSDDEVDFSDAIIGDRTAWTLTAWIQMGPDTADQRTIYSEGNTTTTEYQFVYVDDSTSNVKFYIANPPDYPVMEVSRDVEDNQFHYVVMVQRSKTDRELFVDTISSGTNTEDAGTLTNDTASIGLLRTDWVVDGFKGLIDEVRISNIDRSDDWLTTEYNNQSSPGTFYSIATEENTDTTGITLTGGTATGSATGATHTADAGGNSAPSEPATPHINNTTAHRHHRSHPGI
jgi:hypothetical protein